MAATIKISKEARDALARLAAERRLPMGAVLAALIERERRCQFFDEYNAAFDRLKTDPEAWAGWQAELKRMEGTLMDGLEDDPWVE